MSVKSAIERYCKNQIQKEKKARKTKNNKPEKILEKSVMEWLKQNGFLCNVVESKAVFSKKAGRYLKGQTDAGMADIIGNDSSGHGVFIELKAPGKLSTIRPSQYEFLRTKIDFNCFAVCIDSVELLARSYRMWKSCQTTEARQTFLRNSLPKPRLRFEKDLKFDD